MKNSPNEEIVDKNWPGTSAAATTTIRKQQEAAKVQLHQGRHLNDFAKSNSK
jgi:hypothetical protein